ncbi:UrcA family protein [Qipengyuania sp. XHP0207]|uniref:UrcA family protein n=1 Tax=Qipengyuania sp. XHP0207 TaxID=3038078 RepID=UPI00241FD4B7|nr:UrcA family protein [Qipengyuania sp. XHP0207]MDG5748055.1 UrcA family protein [Qipengyuania sp. XHP0207]
MKITLAIAAFAGLSLAIPAQASDTQSIEVPFDDLNLASAAGQERLDRRIEAAARTVCGYERRTGSRIIDHQTRTCLDTARASARAKVAEATSAFTKGG